MERRWSLARDYTVDAMGAVALQLGGVFSMGAP